MVDDDGWGPVQRGGGGGAAAAPPTPPPAPAPPDPPPARGEVVDPGGFGPVQRGRRRRWPGGPRGLVKVLGVTVLVLGLAGVATFGALAVYTSMQINRQDVGGLGRASGQMNVLVVGNDSRQGLTGEELQELGTEAIEGDRTDTIFLLSVSGGRAAMLSFPRDLLVTRCDGSQGRINVAYARGGPTCLTETITQLSSIPVTHYVEVNFLGFIRIVDAVAGVTLYFDQPFADVPAGIDVPAGCQRLDGRRAIGYVRARTDGGDLARIGRQQRFIGELAEEITRPATLLNPPRLFAVGGAAGSSITASQNLGTFDLLRLARAGRGFAGAGLATYTVPGTVSRVGGASVVQPDPDAADALFARFRDGSILRPAEEPGVEGAGPDPGADGPVPAPPDEAQATPDMPEAPPVPADC
ncbi:MAG TPA: LCP family protein [Egibacteraceae bacterium]|nr:LCP family protein [Egibacteraceae bacterium]